MKFFFTTLAIFFCLGLASFLLYTQIQKNIQVVVVSHEKPCAAVTVITPKSQTTTSSPLSISLIVDNSNTSCHWTVFEAQAGIAELLDENNHIIGKTVLTTNDDWQLSKPVPYNGTISFTEKSNKHITLTITEENPSGKSNPQMLSIPLISK